MLEERERAYEAKWAHDEEIRFELMARRNRRLGEWVAKAMKLGGEERRAYAEAVVRAGLSKGADPVFEKVRADFAAHHVECSDSEIHRKMRKLFDEAEAEVLTRNGRNGGRQ